ncbi:hypothetical protein MTO96_049175 [Rhipicephalus appendiculatus]
MQATGMGTGDGISRGRHQLTTTRRGTAAEIVVVRVIAAVPAPQQHLLTLRIVKRAISGCGTTALRDRRRRITGRLFEFHSSQESGQ